MSSKSCKTGKRRSPVSNKCVTQGDLPMIKRSISRLYKHRRYGVKVLSPDVEKKSPVKSPASVDRKSTRLNSSHSAKSRMPSSA